MISELDQSQDKDTPNALYEFVVVPMGLTNYSPLSFVRTLSGVIKPHQSKVLIYLDDILILGITFEEHFSVV